MSMSSIEFNKYNIIINGIINLVRSNMIIDLKAYIEFPRIGFTIGKTCY